MIQSVAWLGTRYEEQDDVDDAAEAREGKEKHRGTRM